MVRMRVKGRAVFGIVFFRWILVIRARSRRGSEGGCFWGEGGIVLVHIGGFVGAVGDFCCIAVWVRKRLGFYVRVMFRSHQAIRFWVSLG